MYEGAKGKQVDGEKIACKIEIDEIFVNNYTVPWLPK